MKLIMRIEDEKGRVWAEKDIKVLEGVYGNGNRMLEMPTSFSADNAVYEMLCSSEDYINNWKNNKF